jgi:hypothetical protein
LTSPIRILLFQRGKYGERVVETVQKYAKKSKIARIFEIPIELPEIIEDPSKFIPDDVFKDIDLVITYSLHPDLSQYIVEQARKYNIKTVIMPGEDPTYSMLGARNQLLRIAGKEVEVFGPED